MPDDHERVPAPRSPHTGPPTALPPTALPPTAVPSSAVPSTAVPSTRSARTLPPEALAGLRQAFAGEVSSRLPRLLALLDGPPGPDAVRDAHTLGSSAVVVGEPDASRTARALEAQLVRDVPDPAEVHRLVRELADRLGAWVHA